MPARTVAFALGALFCHQLAELPDPLLAGLAPMLLPLVVRGGRLAVGAAFCLGVAWTTAHASVALGARLPPALQTVDLLLTGRVVGIPQRREGRVRFTLALSAVEAPLVEPARWAWRGCRVRLTSYSPRTQAVPAPGERWRVSARLKQPRGLRNPGGFDSEHRALRERRCARGYVRDSHPPRRLDGSRLTLDAVRHALARRLDERLAGLPTAGIVKALVVGVREDVAADQRRLLQRTGTAHLMAISGLHVGLIAGLGLLAGGFAARRSAATLRLRPAADWAAGSALLAAGAYAALAGFSVPTQRALIMLGAALACGVLRRRGRRDSVLALALVGVLALDPLAVLDAGTWLSFGAVAGLLWALDPRPARPRVAAALGTAFRVQVAACVALVPLTVWSFSYQSAAAPLCNLLAVPVTGLIAVPLALAGTALDAVAPELGAPVLRLAAHVMGVLLEVLARVPFGDRVLVPAASPSTPALLLALVGVLLVLLPGPGAPRWLGVAWLSPLLLPAAYAPAPGELWLQVLDVGQGLAVVVRTREHTLVFDAGPRWGSGYGAGDRVVAPALMRQGLAAVDVLVVSHAHLDHAGGARGLLDSVRVARVVGDGSWLEEEVTACRPGRSWRRGGYLFELLHPSGPVPASNDASCVLRVSGPGGSVLLPADLEARGERELVARAGARLRSDVLLVPHHGSATSSSPGFLAAVAPRIAVNSSGHRNRFRLPARRVVGRYRALGVRFLDTACSGQIRVRLAPGAAPEVSTWADAGLRFWHTREQAPHCRDAGPGR